MGETLQQFVKRQRLERALQMMSHAPQRSLTDIALDCGFSSSSDFSRNFKSRYGSAPSAFDLQAWRDEKRQALQDVAAGAEGSCKLNRLKPGANPDGFEVVMRDLPPRTVAYIRVTDPYNGGVIEAGERLITWAKARGVEAGQWLGYMWEDPEIVAHADCRYDIAVEVDDVVPDGEIGRFDFPAMRVAEVSLKGDVALELRALDWLFGTWLPQSDYEPDEQPCFEAFDGLPFAHGYEYFELRAHLPVKRI